METDALFVVYVAITIIFSMREVCLHGFIFGVYQFSRGSYGET